MAERGEASGLGEALRLVGAVGGLVDGDGERLELFEAEGAPLPLPVKGASGPKGGRPRGARNRSTDEWVRFFLANHKSPLSVLGNLMSQDLRELHDLLQQQANKHTRMRDTAHGAEEVRVLVDPLAVLKLQRDAAAALLPYIHKAQPKAIEIEDKPRGVLVLGDFSEAATADDAVLLPLAPSEENQLVTQGARPQSDVPVSDSNV